MRRPLLLLALAIFVAITHGHGIKLTKAAPRHHSSPADAPPFANKYRSPSGVRVGNSIPMEGGVLTIGSYYTDITIGTPPRTFSVLVDTGSSNFVLPTVGCATCGKTKFYNASQSSTSLTIGCNDDPCPICSPPGYFGNTSKCVYGPPICQSGGACGFGITYGGGSTSINGALMRDNICLGPYCITGHNFGAILRSDPPGWLETPTEAGLIGFAYDYNACNPSCPTVFFDDVVAKYSIPDLFGMCITPSDGGVIDMGEIDSSKFSGSLQYSPITVQQWWNIAVLDVQIAGYSIGAPPIIFAFTNDVIGSFVDSGTSVILMSPEAFGYFEATFQAKFPSLPGIGNATQQNFFAGDCVPKKLVQPDFASYPNVTFVMAAQGGGSFSLSVPPSAYLMLQSSCYNFGFGGAIGVGLVLGDVFMQNFYIVFDKGGNRLGFAPLTKCV